MHLLEFTDENYMKFLKGEMPESQLDKIRTHYEECKECREHLRKSDIHSEIVERGYKEEKELRLKLIKMAKSKPIKFYSTFSIIKTAATLLLMASIVANIILWNRPVNNMPSTSVVSSKEKKDSIRKLKKEQLTNLYNSCAKRDFADAKKIFAQIQQLETGPEDLILLWAKDFRVAGNKVDQLLTSYPDLNKNRAFYLGLSKEKMDLYISLLASAGTLRKENGDFEGSCQAYKKMLEIEKKGLYRFQDIERSKILSYLGWSSYLLGLKKEYVLDLYDRAIALNPFDEKIYLNRWLATGKKMEADYKKGLFLVEKRLSKNPKPGDYFSTALFYGHTILDNKGKENDTAKQKCLKYLTITIEQRSIYGSYAENDPGLKSVKDTEEFKKLIKNAKKSEDFLYESISSLVNDNPHLAYPGTL